jgi:tetratricopeptide (TPR) repeat protein
LAVCKFAFQEYKKAIAACEDWEKRFPSDGLLAEVLSLKGDVQKTLGDTDAALETYLLAASAAVSDEVMNYTLGEAGSLLEQKKDWPRIISVFTSQIDRLPDSKLAMGWYYWVARAKAKSGQPSEAWDFLADHVGLQIDNPANEDVEKILELMAQISARERRPADAPPPPSPAEQLSARLRLANDPPPLVRARVRYYQSRVLSLSRKPDEAARIMLDIGREMPAAEMSAALLAVAGDALLKNGDSARATPFFDAMLEKYPDSNYRDFAYVGLGNLALERKEPAKALALFDDAINKAGAVHLQREATVGQARSHFVLGNLDKAAKLFELIAGAKEWRGEATALSLYHLGEIAVQQGDLPKGIVFFQRVFVSQVRYSEWVAKSYIASGRAYEALGKKPDAAKTYYEMLRSERLKGRPELAEARERLKVLDPAYTP